MDKIALIDGNSLLNRAYYATPLFSTKSGQPTNAIFGFLKLLFKILDDLKPEYIAVAFDLKGPTFRHKMYSDYKCTRKSMPDDLAAQVMPLKNLLREMKIAICEKSGYEGDDILGTLSRKFDAHSYVYTGDRDAYQLVDDKTDVFYTKRGVSELYRLNKDNFYSEINLEPRQIVDLKALMGDKSDNIPGVAGIGEKTALTLLTSFGDLDGVYANIESVKGATKLKLLEHKNEAYLSRELATIDRNCPVEIDLADCVAPKKFSHEVKNLFSDYEFRTLLNLDIFEGGQEREEIAYPERLNCRSIEDIRGVIEKTELISVVIEERSFEFFADGKEYFANIMDNLFDDKMPYNDYVDAVKLLFENEKIKTILFDQKQAMHILDGYGVKFLCSAEDVLLCKYLTDFGGAASIDELLDYNLLSKEHKSFGLFKLFETYYQSIKEQGMLELYENMEKPLVSVLYDMEKTGVSVSGEILAELGDKFQKAADICRAKVFEACGQSFNLNSPMQLGEVLYNKFGISAVKKKSTGRFTTGAEVLEKIEGVPIIEDILKFRTYQKLVSTYIDGIKPLIDKNGKVHTTYRQTATTTGRLSSTDPNLQNIPIREDEGRELRKMFVAGEGNVFIDADYSQIELRLLAHFSKSKELISAYEKGIDIHSVTASQVFGVPLDEVTDKMRRNAKAVNFGIIYGISEYGLAKDLNISNEEARAYIQKYFQSYGEVKEYMTANVEKAKSLGYVSTMSGRRRVINEINSPNYNLRQFGERAAMNMPLQGSSADIIKIAMIRVYESLKKHNLKTKLILQVHDELVLESPIDEVDKASEILKYEMENAVELSVPLTVDLHVGKNWYDAK